MKRAMLGRSLVVITFAALLLLATGIAQERADSRTDKKSEKPRKPDVIYVPTPQHVVDKMLELAEIKEDDIVYDLGCGDGRIVVTAAKKYGVKAIGFDIDPARIKEAKENVQKNDVEDLVRIEQQDIFKLDLSKANVVTLYLLPSLNVKLIPQLEKLSDGSRIVSHNFDMAGVVPDKVVKVPPQDGRGSTRLVYLWTTPLKKEKPDDEARQADDETEEDADDDGEEQKD